MRVPVPADAEFVARVRREVAAANVRARELLPADRRRVPEPPLEPLEPKGCRTCGCDLDESTPGCLVCVSRHAGRARSARVRLDASHAVR